MSKQIKDIADREFRGYEFILGNKKIAGTLKAKNINKHFKELKEVLEWNQED